MGGFYLSDGAGGWTPVLGNFLKVSDGAGGWSGGPGTQVYVSDGAGSWSLVWAWLYDGQGLSVTPNGAGRLDLLWSPDTNAHGYEIWRADDVAGSPGTFSYLDATTNNYYYNTGLPDSTKYWYEIRGYRLHEPSSYQYGGFSSQVSGTTIAAAPNAPTGLVVTQVASYLSSRLDLNWNDNSGDEDGFRVRRSVDGGGFVEVGASPLPANTTYWQDTGLEGGRTYAYRVTAYKGAFESAYTEDSEVTELETPTMLGAVNDATEPWDAQDITWTLNSAYETEVRVYRNVNGGAFSQYGSPLAAGTENLHATGLDPETAYGWYVTAYNAAAGESATPSPVYETTTDELPGQVTGLQAVPDSTDGDTQLNVSWQDVLDATGYKLYRGTSPGFTPGTPIYTGANTSYPDSGRSPSTPYYYRCLAYNSGGDSLTISDEATGTTWPTVPQSFDAVDTNYPPYIDLSWDIENRTTTALTLEVWDNVASGWDQIAIGAGNESYQHTPGSEHIDGLGEVQYRIKFNGEASYATKTIVLVV